MKNVDIFQMALGLAPPWYVEEVKFHTEDGSSELHISLNFQTGGKFTCPDCADSGCKVHDTKERTWRHLDFFQHKTYIHARVPRIKCEKTGKVKIATVPWGRPNSGFTLLFEAYVLTLVKEMPVNSVARIVRERDTRIWRILHRYVQKAHRAQDFSSVKTIAIDETSRAKGHQYVSLFVDTESKRVLFVTEGKDADVLSKFHEEFKVHGGSPRNITEVCTDMSPAFISGVEKHLPEARITF